MIEARGVVKAYGPLSVLQGIDLDIEPGQITAIVGPNASGKTTFNKIVLGLVRADAGTVRFDGAVVNGTSAYRRRIGYMPQAARYPENLCAHDVLTMLSDLRGQVAAIPIWRISVPMWRRPTPGNSALRTRRRPRAPNHGISRWTASIRRIRARSKTEMGDGA